MRSLKIMCLGLFVLFLHSSILGIPFADIKTCELPNGDKVKTRTSRNWYLLKGLNPHGSAWGGREKEVWYAPRNWFRRNIAIESSGMNLRDYRSNCNKYAMFGDLVDLGNAGFYNSNLHQVYNMPKDHNLIAPYSDDPILPLVKKRLLAKNLMPTFLEVKAEMNALNLDSSRVFFKLDNSTLIYEASLVNKNKEDKPIGCDGYFDDCSPILAVWQSHSTDNGKTWSKPIITKDAKLFVIGKSIKEQPGVAKDKGTLKYIGWF